MTLKELTEITEHVRWLVLMRWTDSDILDHVVIKLPAPIFDIVSADLKADTINKFRPDEHHLGGTGNHFMFNGIKFERVDGHYWSVSAFDKVTAA